MRVHHPSLESVCPSAHWRDVGRPVLHACLLHREHHGGADDAGLGAQCALNRRRARRARHAADLRARERTALGQVDPRHAGRKADGPTSNATRGVATLDFPDFASSLRFMRAMCLVLFGCSKSIHPLEPTDMLGLVLPRMSPSAWAAADLSIRPSPSHTAPAG
jgi:hypothetical protein